MFSNIEAWETVTLLLFIIITLFNKTKNYKIQLTKITKYSYNIKKKRSDTQSDIKNGTP